MLIRVRIAAVLGMLALGSISRGQEMQPSSQPARPLVAFDIAQGDQTWGQIVFELEPRKAPLTVANFLRYVDEGYFDGTIIQRVIVGETARIQVFQGGGYTALGQPNKPGQHEPIKLESQNGLRNARGTIAMARDTEPDTATSEFFVNIDDNYKLDYVGPEKPGYCVFGRIVRGFEVVDRIAAVATRTHPDPQLKGEKSEPLDPPVLRKAYRVTTLGTGEWWFPSDIPTNVRQTFRIVVDDIVTRGANVTPEHEEAEFEVELLPRRDNQPGLIVRLAEPRMPLTEAEENRRMNNLITRWLTGWAAANPDGLTVSPNELLVRDAPLLRGPWRTGDRSRLLGFVAILFFPAYGQVFGFLEYEVQTVEADSVRLALNFWLGPKGPLVRGDGELTFKRDREGITQITARWKRTSEHDSHEVRLTVNRCESK